MTQSDALEELLVETVRRIDDGSAEDPISVELTTSGSGADVILRHARPRRLALQLLRSALTKTLGTSGLVLQKLENELLVSSRTIAEADPVAQIKNIVLVMAGKGGVGKSTVCANLACAMAAMGAKVGLLDADIYGPSVPTLFGVKGPPTSDGHKIQPIVRHGVKLMSIGFLLESDRNAVIWRGPMLHSALMQFLNDVAWNELDYLFLDLPPGTGDVALTLSQKIRSNGAVVVTTPQEMALQDVYKAVSMNEKVGIPVLGVVENQSYFVCGTCSTRHELFGRGGGQKLAEAAGVPLLGQLPLDPEVQQASDAGLPVVQSDPESAGARAFFDLAERVGRRIAEENEGTSDGLLIDRSGGKNRHLPIAR